MVKHPLTALGPQKVPLIIPGALVWYRWEKPETSAAVPRWEEKDRQTSFEAFAILKGPLLMMESSLISLPYTHISILFEVLMGNIKGFNVFHQTSEEFLICTFAHRERSAHIILPM